MKETATEPKEETDLTTLDLSNTKDAKFIVSAELITESHADINNNPLLTWVKLVFTDDKPNANNQGVSQKEFPNIVKTMSYMPIKASFDPEEGVAGHSDAVVIGVIKAGQQEGNKIVAVGAIFKAEYPQIVDYFKKEADEGKRIDFSWELMYKDSEIKEGVEWLSGVTTKAITVVKNPAYEGRTPLISLSTLNLVEEINLELTRRGVTCS